MRDADDTEKVPSLRKKQYADYKLSASEWEYLELVHRVLKEPATATQSFSLATIPSLSCSIPVLEFLIQSWEDFCSDFKYKALSDALGAGLQNLGKWYHSTGESNAYFITMGKLCRFFALR